MNKLFSKIAALSVGLAMAVGVGVAVGSQKAAKVAKADDTVDFTLSSAASVTEDGVTVSFDKASGSNAPAWYAAGLRLYAKNTVTVSSSESITSIVFDWEQQGTKAFATVTADVGTYSHPSAAGEGTWSGSENSVVFTLGASGQLQLNTLHVTYASTSSTFTVTYDANGGSGTMTDTHEYESGDTVTVMYCQFMPADDFHEFNSFNTKADGSGTSYMGGGTFEITKNVTLYAIWSIPTAELSNGSYTATFPFVAAGYPSEFTVENSSSESVGLFTVTATGLARYSTYNEYELQTTGSVVFKNHTNASVTKIVVNVYQYDNFKLSLGSTVLHTGDGKKGSGDPVVFEITPDTPSADDIKLEHYTGTGTYTQKFYSIDFYLKVGSDVVHPSSVSLNATEGTVYVGKTRQLTATVLPADADDRTVSWQSSNTSAVTVSESGLLTGVAEGSATITATTTDGGLTATFDATVKPYSAGTEQNPLTPEEAREVMEINGAGNTPDQIYVRGIVSSSSYTTSDKGNYYTIWLQNSNGSVSRCVELYKPDLSGITGDYTTNGSLKYASVLAYGYGQFYQGTTYELISSSQVLDVTHTADSLSHLLKSKTDDVCKNYVDGESSYDEFKTAFEGIWETLAGDDIYGTLSAADIEILESAERNEAGTLVEIAMARYDFLTGKYQLDNFISGRTPMHFAHINDLAGNMSENNTMIIIIAIASVTALAFTTLLVLKKRKHN